MPGSLVFPNSLSEAIRGTAIPRASEHLNFSNFLVLQLKEILEGRAMIF